MKILFTLFILAGLSASAQDTVSYRKLRSGLSLQAGISTWNQENFNLLLRNNNLPETKKLMMTVGFGSIFQWNNLRFTLNANVASGKRSANGENLEQRFVDAEINVEQPVIYNSKISLSPLVGGGVMSGITRIRRHATQQDITSVFVNRNTAELFNSQGYINAGLALGFAYVPRVDAHAMQLVAGYRIGFAARKWSTDINTEVLVNSVPDELRQFYVMLKMNYLTLRKKTSN